MAKSKSKYGKAYIWGAVIVYMIISGIFEGSGLPFLSDEPELYTVISMVLLAVAYFIYKSKTPNHINDLKLNDVYQKKLSPVKQNKTYTQEKKQKMDMPLDLLGQYNTYMASEKVKASTSLGSSNISQQTKIRKLKDETQSTHTSLSGDITYTTNTSRRISGASNEVYSPFSLDGK